MRNKTKNLLEAKITTVLFMLYYIINKYIKTRGKQWGRHKVDDNSVRSCRALLNILFGSEFAQFIFGNGLKPYNPKLILVSVT